MIKKFTAVYLQEAAEFIDSLNAKVREKVLYNIDKASLENDPKLFKKLAGDIWEFRTKYLKQQIRLFAFWDRRNNTNALVVSTHGLIKKKDRIDNSDIEKSIKVRKQYLGIK